MKKIYSIILLFSIFFHCFSVVAQQKEWVTAKSGDGIYKILSQNGRVPFSNYLNSFVSLNKKNLGKNNSLYIGRKYFLPSKLSSGNSSSLFGPNISTIDKIDNQLSNATFYLVSGHGGPDPGALGQIGSHRLSEDEYAYDVTLRLGRELMRHGAKVHFIIQDKNDGIREGKYLSLDKDEICSPNSAIPLNQVKRLQQRASRVNQLYAKESKSRYNRLLVLHVDARHSKKNIDIFFYHHSKSSKGIRLANTLRTTMEQKYRAAQPNRGYSGTVSTRNLYMLNKTNPPTVYVELGNINNSRDQKRLTVADNRQAIANWMCAGMILDYKKGR